MVFENTGEEKEAKKAELIVSGERRIYPRMALSVPVKYSIVKEAVPSEAEHDTLIKQGMDNIETDKFNSTKSVNISSGGLLITTDSRINPKTTLHLSMYIPLPGLACNCSILGEVVRCEKGENGYNTGIKFIKIIHHNLNKYKYATLRDILNIEDSKFKLI